MLNQLVAIMLHSPYFSVHTYKYVYFLVLPRGRAHILPLLCVALRWYPPEAFATCALEYNTETRRIGRVSPRFP